MSPQEALNFLDQLVSQMQLARQVHVQAQQAVAMLAKTLNPPGPTNIEPPATE